MEGAFDGTFQGMFEMPDQPIYIPEGVQAPLNPAVPLDGGLTALLLAGGAAGDRQYKKKRAWLFWVLIRHLRLSRVL